MTDAVHDRYAEQAVLGSMMLLPAAAEVAADLLNPADFHELHHETIYSTILTLRENHQAADVITVAAELGRTGELGRCGGVPYLHLLIQAPPSPAQAGHYADIVRAHAARRRLAAVGTRLHQMGTEASTDLDDVAELYHVALAELGRGLDATPVEQIPTAADLLGPTLDRIEKPETIPALGTGLHDLDDVLHGLRPGQLVVIGARPRVGKSVMALNLVRHAAITSATGTLLASLEMSDDDIMTRLLAAQAGVNLSHIKTGTCDDRDWSLLGRAVPAIEAAPLHIAYAPALSLPGLRQMVRRLSRDGLGLVAVDYIQLMTAPSAENRQQAVAALSRGLKLLAQEYAVPVVALAQLNRDSEKRTDKRPQMSDLRESGALENDADVVVLLHREELYEENCPRSGEIDLIVEKNRSGPQATVRAAFQGHYSRVASFAPEPWTPHTALRSVA